MRAMGVKRRVTLWRQRAELADRLADDSPPEMRAGLAGYAEALRECADQLELSIVRAEQRQTTEQEKACCCSPYGAQ